MDKTTTYGELSGYPLSEGVIHMTTFETLMVIFTVASIEVIVKLLE